MHLTRPGFPREELKPMFPAQSLIWEVVTEEPVGETGRGSKAWSLVQSLDSCGHVWGPWKKRSGTCPPPPHRRPSHCLGEWGWVLGDQREYLTAGRTQVAIRCPGCAVQPPQQPPSHGEGSRRLG